MLTLFLYISLFTISALLVARYQKSCRKYAVVIKIWNTRNSITKIEPIFVLRLLLCMLPLILIYSLRVNVGADYKEYERIYNTLYVSSFKTYFQAHLLGQGNYYVEVGYYFLNRLANNYHVLQMLNIVLIFSVLFMTLYDYKDRLNVGLAVFIYLSLRFAPSMNVVRFSIALMFVFFSFRYIINAEFKQFAICIALATCFHKTAILCIAFYFLREFNQSYINKIRNALLMTAVLGFPLFSRYLLGAFAKFPIFKRYFTVSVYAVNDVLNTSLKWMWHIVPVMIPILLFGWRYIYATKENRVLFRIYLMNIPFRTLGVYNATYSRLTGYSQIIEVLLIPMILSCIHNKNTKKCLTIYYLLWYTFYSCYVAVASKGNLASYSWIFSG
ncbi:MAG: EpsG family protein [Clostridiales bacterium]|nr:EpsG family protein [Clostridiales bacterium]